MAVNNPGDAQKIVFIDVQEDRTSSTTLVPSTQLVVPVLAYKTYNFFITTCWVAGAGYYDFKLTAPAGCGGYWGPLETAAKSYDWTTELSFTSGTAIVRQHSGLLIVGGVAGNFTFNWGQHTSNGTPSSLLQGSNIVYWEIQTSPP